MIHIEKFVFSPFQENTYVVFNEDHACWIIDPGCYFQHEKEALKSFITERGLRPCRLLNTHAHLDHVFGNAYVARTFGLTPEMHRADQPTLALAPHSAKMYGIPGFEDSPEPRFFDEPPGTLELGDDHFEMRFAPGHAPGHVVFIHHEQRIVIGGDVLFRESIGRTDLPGGNHQQLLDSIERTLLSLDDDYTVYCGHGPETTIGHERAHNPFLLQKQN